MGSTVFVKIQRKNIFNLDKEFSQNNWRFFLSACHQKVDDCVYFVCVHSLSILMGMNVILEVLINLFELFFLSGWDEYNLQLHWHKVEVIVDFFSNPQMSTSHILKIKTVHHVLNK